MQLASSRIWTRVAVSFSYDYNHYTTGTSLNQTKLYRCLIQSKLDYFIYEAARKSYLRKIETLHHLGPCIALGAFITSLIESLYIEAN